MKVKVYVLLHKDILGDVWIHGIFTDASIATEWLKLGANHWYQSGVLDEMLDIELE